MSSWSSRQILRDLADDGRRKRILLAFWRYADPTAKAVATAQLARALHFREETLRKMPAEKKAGLLASRAGGAEFEPQIETALMQYHTHEENAMMAAFLDRWGVPHVNGSIEVEDYKVPSVAMSPSTWPRPGCSWGRPGGKRPGPWSMRWLGCWRVRMLGCGPGGYILTA